MRTELIAKVGAVELSRVEVEGGHFYTVDGRAFEKFVAAYFHYLDLIGWRDPLERERAR